MSSTFEQGWAARPFHDQFPELPERTATYLDKVNDAITLMLVSGMITDSQCRNIRDKRFPKLVSEKVMAAREGERP